MDISNVTSGDREFLTVRQAAERSGIFTELAMRKMLFNCRSNGLVQHVRRVGGKLLIDYPGFINWIDSQREES